LKEMAGSFKKSFEDILNFVENRLNFAGIGKIDDDVGKNISEELQNPNININKASNSGIGVEINPIIKNYGRYKKADYHGKTDNSVKNKSPTDGQDELDNFIEINSNIKIRIAISNNEIVILDEIINGIIN
ncbi:MAG: hypothetical protein ACLUCH_07790, partial [Lachnospirales bacterium]